MKRTYFISILCLLLVGCGLDNSYYYFRNYEKNQELTKTIGSPMLQSRYEYKNNVYKTILQSSGAELIYSGKSGNVIRIVYREYTNDLARPAFSQELQYDLNETTTIKFKSTVIEIIRATNQEITFRVIEASSFKYKPGKLSKEEIQEILDQQKQ